MPRLTRDVPAPTIAADVQSPVVPPSPRNVGKLVRLSAALAVGTVVMAVLVTKVASEQALRSSVVLSQAVDIASRSNDVQVALGTPVSAGVFAVGDFVDDAYGYAAIATSLSGPKGKGTLSVVANRVGGGWDIEREILRVEGPRGRAIDVTPPVVREAVKYPAAGKVYLLPFDATSAEDLRDLPSYFKMRMDVDAVILPTETIPESLVDAKTKQVVAESVRNLIEEAHPQIVQELDAVVVGVMSRDMNMQSWDNAYAINYRHGRFAVVSTARLHGDPARTIADAYPVRVRKIVGKNVAMLHFPVQLIDDDTSALAYGGYRLGDIDAMGENFGGESGTAHSIDASDGCVTILQRRGGAQSWRIECDAEPLLDRHIDTFETMAFYPLFRVAHTDFPFEGRRPFTFVRTYRTMSDLSFAFGVGSDDSFDIVPAGDSKTFAFINIVLATGNGIHYRRTSPGTDYGTAKFKADTSQGLFLSRSTMVWNNGWDVTTRDGWLYRFPSSGPGRTWQKSALIGIKSDSGATFGIKRDDAGDLRELRAPGGDVIAFTGNEKHLILSGTDGSGRTIRYEYDADGRLVHVIDPENGDQFYDYDAANQLTAVRDAERKPLLVNEYGHFGEVRKQTLADGRTFKYVYGYGAERRIDQLEITLPDGYVIEWRRTADGVVRSWPHLPSDVPVHP